ncbi:UbiA-like polyprenyltransferase [Candidatus Oleimmundimicrobium sp.]|uniref:UbiA-like polyprenyltransferase n=1 Tax=Candidatus Oleimmundimicrobium sp. TaxID=3060597 RepID=UPI00272265C1|nr:UbiA-like polyprenyltransferase [Candidatus Oleimmundimicrobium sp.]MDO8885911.1 UbiA-like polyprenyltransferase [Candidatus Oleimmundimicrobium sp.]
MNKIAIIFKMIKFEHSIFALPFAYMGAILAAEGLPTFWQVFWITVAMVGARSLAMSLNRLIDKEIDKKNPRTKNRALPKKLLSEKDVLIFSLISLVVFLLAVYSLAPLCRWLWPFIVLPFVVYPYTKRFTWYCHLFLGMCLGLAPIGAWIAIKNSVSLVSILLGVAVCLWVAGFDIIYACQDIQIDKEQNLYSIPAKFGIEKALRTAGIFHLFSVGIFLLVGILANLGLIYFFGLGVVSFLLLYENRLVSPDDLSKLNAAFFTMNGVISTVMFVFTFLDFMVKGVAI